MSFRSKKDGSHYPVGGQRRITAYGDSPGAQAVSSASSEIGWADTQWGQVKTSSERIEIYNAINQARLKSETPEAQKIYNDWIANHQNFNEGFVPEYVGEGPGESSIYKIGGDEVEIYPPHFDDESGESMGYTVIWEGGVDADDLTKSQLLKRYPEFKSIF